MIAVAALVAAVSAGTGGALPPASSPRWSVEASLGNAWNAPLPLTIRQPGAATLDLNPRWSTRGLEFPLYYGVRVARGGGRAAWALDLVHHKLFLQNPPAEVRQFSISHGYNLITLQRLRERGSWRHGFGAGVVLAHPENEVRGRRLDEHRGLFRAGYHLAGPTVAALGGYSFEARPGFHLGVEVRLTYSHAEVPVAGGYARVPNLAMHGSVGARFAARSGARR